MQEEEMRACGSIVAVGIVAVIACAGPMAYGQQSTQPAPNPQQQRMKSCNAEAAQERLKGDARKSFMSECLSGGKAAAGSTIPQRDSRKSQQDKMKACNARAKTEKLSGDARKSFMSDCLGGNKERDTAASRQGTAPGAERAPRAATPPASAGTAGTSQPPPRAAPSPRATATAAATGQYPTEQEAQRRCPGGTVVWANTESGIYHYAGTRSYGHTKQGAYMCQQDGNRAGYRPAKNEKAPQ